MKDACAALSAVWRRARSLCPAPAFADQVHDALNAYALYQNDVSALLDNDIANGRTVDAALARISRHNPANVGRGWIAYGALTAAQSPVFAAGVQRVMRGDDRALTLRMLRDDLTYARRHQNGSSQAIALILSAASADGARAGRPAIATIIMRARRHRAACLLDVSCRSRRRTRLTAAMRERLNIGALDGAPDERRQRFRRPRFLGFACWALAARIGRTRRTRARRLRLGHRPHADLGRAHRRERR